MQYNKSLIVCLISAFTSFGNLMAQSIGINSVGATPDASSILDVSAANKGMLVPRVALISSTDAVTVLTPATSLLVYNLGTGGLSPAGYYYNSGTSGSPVWVQLLNGGSPGTAWQLLGNTGTTAGTHFIGTTDVKDLVFKTNNTEWMRILSGGNVGIGITTPAGKLDVDGAGSDQFYLGRNNSTQRIIASNGTDLQLKPPIDGNNVRIVDGNTINSLDIMVDGNVNLYVKTPVSTAGSLIMTTEPLAGANGDFVFNGGGASAELLRIKGSGNVGVGITSPTAKLHINKGATPADGIVINGTNDTRVMIGVGQPTVWSLANGSATAGDFSLIEEGVSGSRIYVKPGGNVGIGTTSPAAKLDVNGNIQTNSQAIFTSPSTSNDARIWMDPPTGQMLIDQNTLNQPIVFRTNTGFLEKMRITWNGNVGIGTTGPGAKLHVSGGDVYLTDQTINNYNTSRSAFTLRTDNITAASDNGIRIYDGNSNGHLHVGNLGSSYIQSYNTASLIPGTLGTSTLDFDDNTNFSSIFLNPLGGNIGIGTTGPTSLLSVNGTADNTTGVWGIFSDERLKKNIHSLQGALETLTKLQGVKFHWKDSKKDSLYGEVMGFIAQDVEKVIPRWVKTSSDGYKMLETTGINALFVEAIKEQQEIIEEQNQNIQFLKEELNKVKIQISSLATK